MAQDTLPKGTFYSIPRDQYNGMLYAITMGFELTNNFPWIAEDFRNGKSIREISEDGRIKAVVKGKERTLMQAVTYSLKGYDGSISESETESYQGLLEIEEYESLWRKHNQESTAAWNQEMQRRGIGLAGMTKEKRKNIGSRSAKKQIREKIGIHSQSYDEKRELGRLGIIQQGKTPWTDDEMEACYELSQNPEYIRGVQRINWIQIKDIINRKYHDGNNVRDNKAVAKAALRWKEHLSKLGEDVKTNDDLESMLEDYAGGVNGN